MENLIDKEKLIEKLGGNISIRTIDDWVHDSKIPYVKVGRFVRFEPTKIDRWLNKRTHQPKTQEVS